MVEEGWLKVFNEYFRDGPKLPNDEYFSKFDNCAAIKSNRLLAQYIYANFYNSRHMFKRYIDVNTMLEEWVFIFRKGVWAKPKDWYRFTLVYFNNKVQCKDLIDNIEDWNAGIMSVFVPMFEKYSQKNMLCRNTLYIFLN